MFYSFSRVGLRFNIFIKNKHNGLAEMKVWCRKAASIYSFLVNMNIFVIKQMMCWNDILKKAASKSRHQPCPRLFCGPFADFAVAGQGAGIRIWDTPWCSSVPNFLQRLCCRTFFKTPSGRVFERWTQGRQVFQVVRSSFTLARVTRPVRCRCGITCRCWCYILSPAPVGVEERLEFLRALAVPQFTTRRMFSIAQMLFQFQEVWTHWSISAWSRRNGWELVNSCVICFFIGIQLELFYWNSFKLAAFQLLLVEKEEQKPKGWKGSCTFTSSRPHWGPFQPFLFKRTIPVTFGLRPW